MKSWIKKLIAKAGGTNTGSDKPEPDDKQQLPDLDKTMLQALAEPGYLPEAPAPKPRLIPVPPSSEIPSIKTTTSDNGQAAPIQSIEQYLDAGGIITNLPPQRSEPKRFEYVRFVKGSDPVKLSEYAPVRVPKGEALANRLNMKSQDFSDIGHSTSPADTRLTPEQIHAAWANQPGFTESHEHFVLYVLTRELRYRSRAWALLMRILAEDKDRQGWEVRKRGILMNMAYVALDNFLYPHEYKHLSARRWAELLDLSCDKDWSKRWRDRYNGLMFYGYVLLDEAQDALRRNL